MCIMVLNSLVSKKIWGEMEFLEKVLKELDFLVDIRLVTGMKS